MSYPPYLVLNGQTYDLKLHEFFLKFHACCLLSTKQLKM